MQEIVDQAMREWEPTNGSRAMAVSDFDRIVVLPAIQQANVDVPEMGTRDEAGLDFNTDLSASTAEASGAALHMPAQSRGHGGGGWRGRGRGRGGHGHRSQHGTWFSSTSYSVIEH